MTLTCMCCGFTQEFIDGEEAFETGWDAPPHFSGYVACDLCPGSFVVLGITHQHDKAHECWAKFGRPSEFEIPV
jgi:hypothetical protein